MNKPIILAYHSINDQRSDSLSVSTKNFRWQIEYYLKRGYKTITLEDYALKKYSDNQKILIITFDDGYVDNYYQAFPILKELKCTAQIFLTVDFIDTNNIFWWDENKIETGKLNDFLTLNLSQIIEMREYGISFGSHTLSHPKLSTINIEDAKHEIRESKKKLEKLLNCEISAFCYPHGDLNVNIINLVKEAGYKNAVLTSEYPILEDNHFCLQRTGIYNETSRIRFHLKNNKFFRMLNEILINNAINKKLID
jgi:peptidoglycan/xylan/chitin deacetylase (PgdA/CDA1 family)